MSDERQFKTAKRTCKRLVTLLFGSGLFSL